jgi:hypothetical protein
LLRSIGDKLCIIVIQRQQKLLRFALLFYNLTTINLLVLIHRFKIIDYLNFVLMNKKLGIATTSSSTAKAQQNQSGGQIQSAQPPPPIKR